MEHLNHLLVSMKPWLEQYGYLAIIVSVFLEGIGIPLPGQSLVIAAALLSSEQIMDLGSVALVAWLSCFFGNTCGYLIGFHFEEWLDKKGYISGPKIQKMQDVINKHGPACLVISRFIEGMKQFMPLVCGIAKMPMKPFLLGNALASTIWVTVFCLLTHFAFDHLKAINHFYAEHRLLVWSSGALVFFMLVFTLVKRRKTKRKKANADTNQG